MTSTQLALARSMLVFLKLKPSGATVNASSWLSVSVSWKASCLAGRTRVAHATAFKWVPTSPNLWA